MSCPWVHHPVPDLHIGARQKSHIQYWNKFNKEQLPQGYIEITIGTVQLGHHTGERLL